MPIAQELRTGLIACVLIGAALSSAALTLSRSRGAALIGRPLDIAIPLSLDTAGQADDLCPAADVFHGDSRVDASRVTVRVESSRGRDAVVRVRSNQPVDEPVVTVYLKLGCTQQTTRRYVLLAEEPAELPAPGAVAQAVAAPAVAPARPATGVVGLLPALPQAAGSAGSAEAANAGGRATRAPVIRARRSTITVPEVAPRAPSSRSERLLAPRQSQGSGGSRATARLRLDLLDLLPERDPSLRSSPGLTGEPSNDQKVRAEAAALWRSINAQPQDVLRDLERVQALETDVKTIRGLVAGNDRTLAELREQLAQARQERTLTLAVVALLSLLLAAMVVTWWLRRADRFGQRDWWRRGEPVQGAASIDAAAPRAKPAAGAPGRVQDADLRVDESMFESLKAASRSATTGAVAVTAAQAVVPARATLAVPPPAATPAAPAATSEPLASFHSAFQSSRMVKAEELVDIQQQADFFLSIGQTDQAIEVLESHIRHNVETSALVWLDLLAIYRSLKRPQDYELLRSDFQQAFNAEVPSYDSTPTASGGLEDYPRALSRIAALWPSPKVMDVIEESIFRKPGAGDGKPFDLEAYRELVMLYNLGREVVEPSAVAAEDWSEAPTTSFYETSIQPLSVLRDSGHSEAGPSARLDDSDFMEPMDTPMDTPLDVDSILDDSQGPETGVDWTPDPTLPRPSPRLGLDIDLSGPGDIARPMVVPDFGTDSTVDFELSGPGDEPSKQRRKT